MPRIRRTVFNPDGELESSPMDAINMANANRAQSAAELAQRLALARESLQAQMSDNAANRSSMENIQGRYSDRAGHESAMQETGIAGNLAGIKLGTEGQANVARINVGPQQTYADIAKAKADAEMPMIQGKGRIAGLIFQDLERGLGGGGQGAPDAAAIMMGQGAPKPGPYAPGKAPMTGGASGALPDRVRNGLLLGILGGDTSLANDPDEMFLRQLRQAQAAKALETADPSQFGAIAEGAKTGDFSGVPTPHKEVFSQDAIEGQVGGLAEQFAQADNSYKPGGDPGMPDVERLVKERDRLAQYYMQTQRIDAATARDAANRVIDGKVAPLANNWGTGWIRTLRQALGIGG